MGRFFNKIAQFMYGRYKNDQMNTAIAITGLFFLVAARILGVMRWSETCMIISSVFSGIYIALFAWFIFRFLSKNIYKRTYENKKFLKMFAPVKDFFLLQYRKIKDRKTHRYVKCPYCKAQLRVPFKLGKHHVRCPKCKADFETNIKH